VRNLLAIVVGLLALTTGAHGQVSVAASVNVTIAIFTTGATDPNVNSPVAPPVTYRMATCGAALGAEQLVNPTTAFWNNALSGTECTITITPQITALTNGTYKGAMRIGGGRYGTFSSTFTRS
jgi:hypothetical protein